MRSPDRAVLAIGLALIAPGAQAAGRATVSVPGGRLATVIQKLGRQQGASIGLTDASLGDMIVPAFHGHLGTRDALDELLAGTSAQAVEVGPNAYRIVRRPISAAPAPSPRLIPPPDIMVTASKRGTPLASFPGAVSIYDGRRLEAATVSGTDAIVARMPALSSTQLGPGRNKLFIRGIADSSFNGPTQATVGQYFGETRLNYNAPDPNLTLFDIASVEVLSGPQGTLYGVGSLGGIVRLVPAPPAMDRIEGLGMAGLSGTTSGKGGSDVAVMGNLPLSDDRLAVRGVLYRSVDGGYIDDAGRGLADINRTRTIGGRLALRWQPDDGWTIDLHAVAQGINSADGQYAERGLPKRQRRSVIAQPFDNDYALADAVVTRNWGRMTLLSATGVVRHDVDSRYDATRGGPDPILFDQTNKIVLITNETRLSHRMGNGGGWVIGTSIAGNIERLTRMLGPIGAPVRITGVRNNTLETALYGEWTQPLDPHWSITAGSRITFARLQGRALDTEDREEEPSRTEFGFLPSLAVSWRPNARLIAFMRYQEGFRPGGLSVAGTGSGLTVSRFKGDNVGTWEAGFRSGDDRTGRLQLAATVAFTRWKNIQADLIDASGLPFTANIGTGRVLAFDANATWRPLPGLSLEAALFVSDSRLGTPAPAFAASRGAELPNVAEIGAQGRASYHHDLGPSLAFDLGASARYVGRSRLGIGPSLDIPQGRYVELATDARLGMGRFGISLNVTNLLNANANRFSLGDPFTVSDRLQTTPLRPRTIRVGVDARF